MQIRQLNANQFRNLEQIEVHPGSGGNILYGANAQGKTASIEAIYLLGHGRSFRTAKGTDLIRHGSKISKLTAEIENAGVEHRLELTLEEQLKIPRVDGKKVAGMARFLGWLRPVLFAPEEVSLVKASPAGRRALLDRAIFQSDTRFLDLARDYLRCLKQRNRLLKLAADSTELKPWTSGLITAGAELRSQRVKYLQRLRPFLQQCYCQLSAGQEQVDIHYPVTEEDQHHYLEEELARRSERERLLRQTLAGPHRDDPVFLLDGRSLKTCGSQGQQRSFMLAFKAAQVLDLETYSGATPVLLLDDMTSELDAARQLRFFNFLAERQGQFFLTTTNPDLVAGMIPSVSRYFRVEGGTIRNAG